MVSSYSLISPDAFVTWLFFCKAVSILLKLKGHWGYKGCLALGPAVQIQPRVIASERWPADIGHQSACGLWWWAVFHFTVGVWEPGMPKPTYGTSVWSVSCSSDCFQVILSGLKISLPSCQSEPTAEETVIRSASRICCFLALRSRSLEVKVESQKLRNLPGSNVSLSVDKFERTSISVASNIVSWQVLSYHSSRYVTGHRKLWMTDTCLSSSTF